MSAEWERADLPHAQWLHDTFYDKPDSAMDALERIAVDLVDHLNAHHPKPQPYDQGGVRGADSLLYRAERERDAAVARAEQAEQLIPAYAMLDIWVALGRDSIHFDDWYDHNGYADAWAELTSAVREARTAPAVSRADVEKAIRGKVWAANRDPNKAGFHRVHVDWATDAVWSLVSGDDPAVHVVRESDLPAARVDGDYYVVASAKGDYKWPQHGPSWWAGRAQDALAEAARYTSLARLAADREATVDPVEELAEQIETATRAAIRQACDDLAGVVPALDPLAVEQAMEVRAASRKVAAHVLGQEASSDE